MTYAEIVTLINTNLADKSNIKAVKHREVEIALLDYFEFKPALIGGFQISDIDDNAVTVNSPFGIVSSVNQELNAGFFCKIRVNLNQSIAGDYQPFISCQWLGGGTNANVFEPMIIDKNTNNFAIGLNEGSTAVQNLKVYIKIEKII
jgi:hypothetical protein